MPCSVSGRGAPAGSSLSRPSSAAVLIAIVLLWFGDFFGERTTLGSIVVGSPAIYTRERLVNDRFLQDAWLADQLNPASEIQDALATVGERRGGVVRAGEASPSVTPVAPGGDSPGASQAAPQPRMSSRARLLRAVDYREVVRSLMIENQLDDRHDLNGNSLYRFKFDASVLPGANTQASARITVRLIGPKFLTPEPSKGQAKSLSPLGGKDDIKAWRTIYSRWIESLRTRLNQTHNELKQGFYNNEFSRSNYARFTEFLASNLNVAASEIPACSQSADNFRRPERPASRLPLEEHLAHKRCIEAIVERTVPKFAFEGSLPADVKAGNYTGTGPEAQRAKQANPPATLSAPHRSRLIQDTVDAWLSLFFASNTIKLVLGPYILPRSFVEGNIYDIPALRNLARLTFFNPLPTATGVSNVFGVAERMYSIAAIDPTRATKDELQKIAQDGGPFANHQLEDFVRDDAVLPGRLLVSRLHRALVKGEGVELSEDEFRDISAGKGFYLATAEIGLLNFVETARQNSRIFTYAVTPKESADSIDVTLSTDSRVEGPLPAGSEKAGAQLRRETTTRALEQRTVVVGFAGASKEGGAAEFGWLISPRQLSLDGLRRAYVQIPAQYSLSALVSIPSWWNKARFQVTTSWLGKDGRPMNTTAEPVEYEVDVPTDFEPLEALLLGIEQLGPELMESRLDVVALTACQPGEILISGRRLWRSTKVTLGSQTADAISVLPNMKGIIARFTPVQNQMGLEEETSLRGAGGTGVLILRTVRVWTSQGSVTLPQPASIGIPAGTPAVCPKPEMATNDAARKSTGKKSE